MVFALHIIYNQNEGRVQFMKDLLFDECANKRADKLTPAVAADIPDAERIYNDEIPEFEKGLTDEVYADAEAPEEV